MEGKKLPDIQCSIPDIPIPIQQVGVENVEVPFLLESKYGGHHELVANVSMRTSLNHQTKGISMSRLIRTLRKYLNKPLKQILIRNILEEITDAIGCKNSFMKFEFRMPIERTSPISDNTFPIYIPCRFEGQYKFNNMSSSLYNFTFYEGVRVQYASYCPCSAELCNHLEDTCSIQGYPHNQRSYADILVETISPELYVWLEDLIEAVESVIPTLPYPIIKREDEQEIARIAAENPMFVEDAIRTISNSIDNLPVHDWIIKCIHEESIHTSEAIAVNWKGVDGGFDGRRFI